MRSIRHISSMPSAASYALSGQPRADAPSTAAKARAVRSLGMVPFRLLVRFKVFQLAAVAALAIPISTFLSEVRHQAAPIVSTRHT